MRIDGVTKFATRFLQYDINGTQGYYAAFQFWPVTEAGKEPNLEVVYTPPPFLPQINIF